MQPNHSSLILIVDDTPTNVRVLFDCLKAEGYRVLVALDGKSALEKLQEILPDLILLDVMMPEIDGFETCRRIKQMETLLEVPVIFMTALSDSVDKVKGLSLGAVDYITKPFQQEEVIARIQVHLKLRKLTCELRQVNQKLEERVEERTAELEKAIALLQRSQLHLVQSEKMSALGNLVAGVAHEINNPVSFLIGNLLPAREYLNDLFRLIDLYQQKFPNPGAEIEDEIAEIELDYLRQDYCSLLDSMQSGIERIRSISTSLRTFSRADTEQQVSFNIHEGIDSTLLILKHRLKANDDRPEIEVIRNYGELAAIECFPGQVNQVFMNLLANAIDALEDYNRGRSYQEIEANPNRITIQTGSEDKTSVFIRIQDNGIGMTEEMRQKIFDHSFTTKAVGKGTGLGLAIAYQIIVEKHGGTIAVNSRPGEGTEFIISLNAIA